MSKKKGDRRERQAEEILDSAGYNTEKPNSTPFKQKSVDFFECFDIMAVREDEPVLFIQVKANVAREINDFVGKCKKNKIPFDYVKVEFWVCHDRKGWRIFKIESDGYELVFDERDENKKMLNNRIDDMNIDKLPHH